MIRRESVSESSVWRTECMYTVQALSPLSPSKVEWSRMVRGKIEEKFFDKLADLIPIPTGHC